MGVHREIGYILLKLSVRLGMLILEEGTGWGSMTLTLGRVVTYEVRPEFHELAKQDIDCAQIPPGVVELKLRDIAAGVDESKCPVQF